MSAAAITAVADRDEDRLHDFVQQFDVNRTFTDAAEMLAGGDYDFVDIVTRPASHVPLVRLAADAGVPVLCQKPFTPGLDQARELVAYCAGKNVPLMVNENWRWQPWYRELKGLLEAGQLGDPHHLRFLVRPGDGSGGQPYDHQPYFRQMERFFIKETLVHHLDTARFLLGDLSQLYCQTQRLNPAIAGEDFALISLSFASGAAGSIDANRYAGAQASMVFGETVLECSRAAAAVQHDGTIVLTALDGSQSVHSYERPEIGYRGDSCLAAQRHFIQSLIHGSPFETGGEAYLKTLEAVEAAYQSAATGEAVRLS